MKWEYRTYGEKCIQVFLVGKPKERDHLADIGVDGRIIL
jgi:hypothetical protein